MSKEDNNWVVQLDYNPKKKVATKKLDEEAQTVVFIASKIKNLGYEKDVTFHYRDSISDKWQEHKAKFDHVINAQEELWCDALKFQGEYVEYAIKYEVGGITYWDNNHGKNYKTYRDGKTIK